MSTHEVSPMPIMMKSSPPKYRSSAISARVKGFEDIGVIVVLKTTINNMMNRIVGKA